jgi:hypothetical protein
MTAFNIGGFRAAVKSAAEATPPSLRYVSHPGAAAYRSVYNDSSKLIARNVASKMYIPKGFENLGAQAFAGPANHALSRTMRGAAQMPAAAIAANRTLSSGMDRFAAKRIAQTVAKDSGYLSKAKAAMKGHGKLVAGAVAGAVVINGMRSRSGRAADQVRGRPTGPYMY